MEDIPAIMPVAIALSLILVTLSWLFVDYSEKSSALSLQRAVQNVAEQLVFEKHGVFESAQSEFNVPIPYQTDLAYSILADVNTTAPEKPGYRVVVSLPVVVRNPTTGETAAERLYASGKFK